MFIEKQKDILTFFRLLFTFFTIKVRGFFPELSLKKLYYYYALYIHTFTLRPFSMYCIFSRTNYFIFAPTDAFSFSPTLRNLLRINVYTFCDVSTITDSKFQIFLRIQIVLSVIVADAWVPEVQTRNEFLQIDLGNIIPIFGLEVQGSTELDAYVSSFSILYSENGNTFSQVRDANNNLKVGYRYKF